RSQAGKRGFHEKPGFGPARNGHVIWRSNGAELGIAIALLRAFAENADDSLAEMTQRVNGQDVDRIGFRSWRTPVELVDGAIGGDFLDTIERGAEIGPESLDGRGLEGGGHA